MWENVNLRSNFMARKLAVISAKYIYEIWVSNIKIYVYTVYAYVRAQCVVKCFSIKKNIWCYVYIN